MVIGGAATITGSLLGGAYYVLVPQWVNSINPNLGDLLQGAILLLTLFLLPGGLVTLPRTLARKLRQPRPGGRSDPEQSTSAPPAPERGTAQESPTAGGIPTERQEQS